MEGETMYKTSALALVIAFGCTGDQKDPEETGVETDTDTTRTAGPDEDGDGYGASEDCNDGDPAINPGAAEACNGIDDNCDGAVDEGLYTSFYKDTDGDGFGNPDDSAKACAAPQGFVADGTDCDDNDPAVNPSSKEVCNGVDDNCDSLVDDDDPTVDAEDVYYADTDGDGYGDADAAITACDWPSGYTTNSTDCDDSEFGINPGVDELCDDLGVDEDCDGLSNVDDPDTTVEFAYLDDDGDGYGDADIPGADLCVSKTGAGISYNNWDCNDGEPAINPAIDEFCDDKIDNDCDGEIDVCGPAGTLYGSSSADFGLSGSENYDAFGIIADDAGDINGDGTNDLMVPAYSDDPGGSPGSIYFYHGPVSGENDKTTSDGLLQATTATYQYTGYDAAGVGDVDGDGYDDLLVSRYYYDDALLFHGPITGTASMASHDYQLNGNDKASLALDSIEDFNGDGVVDFVLGAPGYDRVQVFYGPVTASTSYDLTFEESSVGSDFGNTVKTAGDTNGDGLHDLILGDDRADHNADDAGAAYIFLGGTKGTTSADSADGSIRGTMETEYVGHDVSTARDHNGDGYDDVIVGAQGAIDGKKDETGAAYLFYGPITADIDTVDADVQLWGEANGNFFGYSVDAEGDLDRDGLPDVAVFAPYRSDPTTFEVGAGYVFVGPLTGTIDATDAHATLVVETTYNLGEGGINFIDDMDGDGTDEVVVHAPWASTPSYTWAGRSHLWYGSNF